MGLLCQDIFDRQLIRPKKVDMARLIGEEMEIVKRAAKESVSEAVRVGRALPPSPWLKGCAYSMS